MRSLHCAICVIVLLLVCGMEISDGADAPHIVFIVVDDLGWNDVGFHGSNQIPTPNIDVLAYNGVMLNSHYSQSITTAARAALMTGKFPMRLGMQGPSISAAEKRALPEGKILPQYLKDLGYTTHLVGKWNLGHSRWNETPTFRGFDHHYGIYNDWTSYYDYVSNWIYNGKNYAGFDLRSDGQAIFDDAGKYATDLFTEYAVKTITNHDANKPLFLMMSHLAVRAANDGKQLEAPQENINKVKHIVDPNRRTYAGMVSRLDDSVGSVVEALQGNNMLQNSIIIFISDNGAPTIGETINWGSNGPLRGIKNTLFEGGIRTTALIWSPLIVQNSRVAGDLFHITDWLPTLISAANGDISVLDEDVDGIDQWSSLVYDLPSARNDILINIDEKTRNAALRFYNWKLIVGANNNGTFNNYFGDLVKENIVEPEYDISAVYESMAGQNIRKISFPLVTQIEYESLRGQATLRCLGPKAKRNPCDPVSGSVCLYDIPSDPCEENDLAKFFPSVVRRMKRALVDYRKGLVPQPENEDIDIEGADPKLFGYTWNPWLDCTGTCPIPA